MTIMQQFKTEMASKYTIFDSMANLENHGYTKPQVIKVLGAAKGCFVVLYQREDYFYAEFWRSKRVKNAESYCFKTTAHRKQYVEKFITNCRKAEERRLESRKTVERGLEVGDVLSAMWGYDQTNYNYYQVTKLIGKTQVEVREISQMTEQTNLMQGKCAPVAGSFIGEPMKRVAKNGRVKICDVIRASKMDYKEIAGTRIYDAGHFSSYH